MRAVFVVLILLIVVTGTFSALISGRKNVEVQTLSPGADSAAGYNGSSLLRSVCEASERQKSCATLSAGITARECCEVFRKCC